MASSARRPEIARNAAPARRKAQRPPSAWERAGSFVLRNPKLLGGGTAFAVALSFVSANALWYQPHAHAGPFFATRPMNGEIPVGSTLPAQTARAPADPTLLRVQSALRDLGAYAGPLDGLDGPNTRKAILSFQGASGLPATGELDADLMAALMEHVGASETVAVATAPEELRTRARTMKIQAGLKAFGNENIEIDGISGARTEAAIREFQKLFGLGETGVADEGLLAKMREVGLVE